MRSFLFQTSAKISPRVEGKKGNSAACRGAFPGWLRPLSKTIMWKRRGKKKKEEQGKDEEGEEGEGGRRKKEKGIKDVKLKSGALTYERKTGTMKRGSEGAERDSRMKEHIERSMKKGGRGKNSPPFGQRTDVEKIEQLAGSISIIDRFSFLFFSPLPLLFFLLLFFFLFFHALSRIEGPPFSLLSCSLLLERPRTSGGRGRGEERLGKMRKVEQG